MTPPLWVGLDVGGTKVLAAVVDDRGVVVRSIRWDTPARESSSEALEDVLAEAVLEIAQGDAVAGVGVAAAGFVDRARASVRFAPHLPWRDAPVRERLEQRLDVRVALDNDANCAALAEGAYGAARGVGSALVITLGTGIGGAVLLEGELWRGATGMAGEFGHMQVVPDGLHCECGRRGCWEQYCSGRAVSRTLDLRPAPEAYDSVGRWLGLGVANLTAAFDPELVVIGGGAASAGDALLDPAREVLAESVVGAGHREVPPIVAAALGPDAGAIGAALLARREG